MTNAKTDPDGSDGAVAPPGIVIWFTGLPAAGKTTLAQGLKTLLVAKRATTVLDGDELRRSISQDLGYSPEDRAAHVQRVAQRALSLALDGATVCVAVIAPYAADRESARQLISRAGIPFFLVFVDAPASVRMERDPKGLYRRALSGNLPAFTGVSAPYEIPREPDLTVHTDLEDVREATARIWAHIEKRCDARSA
jgi:adenylyl-sulfate kinase